MAYGQYPGGGGGYPPGGGGGNGGYDPIAALRQDIANLRQQFNQFAGGARNEIGNRLQQADQRLSDLATVAAAIKGQSQNTVWHRGQVRIEDIPGRRVPFTLLMDIPIKNNTTSVVEQSITIPQEGPFVAVRRMATFQSSLQFQLTDPVTNTQGTFSGRSFGRYRPIHSAWDLNDALSDSVTNTPNPLPIGALPAAVSIITAKSGFRTMEFDGRISFVNAGSSYPRQNISVPSSMWTPQINAPQDLGALDFFERGEVLNIQITPNHVNNPPFGNAEGFSIFGSGVSGYPFLDGQFDVQEGIVTPGTGALVGGANPAFTVTANGVTTLQTDSVQRLPDGLMTIGWEGYRIIQPVGPVQ